jgi:hypothetical protein
MTTEEIIKLALQFTGSKDLKEGAEAADDLKDSLKGVAEQEEKAEAATEKLKAVIEKGTEAFNKFSSGGIEEVIPFISELLEKVPGIGPAFTIVNKVIEYGIPLFKKLSEHIGDSNEQLAPFKKFIDTTAGSMEAFKNRQEAVNAAMKDYVALIQQSAEEEKKAETAKADKEFKEGKKKPTTREARQQERAEIFMELTRDSPAEIVEEVTKAILDKDEGEQVAAIESEFQGRMKDIKRRQGFDLPAQTQMATARAKSIREKALAALPKKARERAEALIAGAGTGSEEGLAALAEAVPAGGLTADIARQAGPEAQEARRKQAFDQWFQADHDKWARANSAGIEQNMAALAQDERHRRDRNLQDRRRRAAAQDKASEEAKQWIEEAEAPPSPEQLTAAAKKADHEQAMGESRQLVGQAFAEAGYRPNAEQLDSAAEDALRRFEQLGNGWLAAVGAVKAKIDTLNQAMGTMEQHVRGMRLEQQMGGQRPTMPSMSSSSFP